MPAKPKKRKRGRPKGSRNAVTGLKRHGTVNLSVRVSESHRERFRATVPPDQRRRVLEAWIERDCVPGFGL